MKALIVWRRYRGKKVPACYAQGKDRYYKEWRSTCGRYRIIWRNQFQGISLDPGYFANVQGPPHLGVAWDRLTCLQRKLNRTLKAAQKQCEAHLRENHPREVAAIMGQCEKKNCRKQALEGTQRCKDHTLKRKRK